MSIKDKISIEIQMFIYKSRLVFFCFFLKCWNALNPKKSCKQESLATHIHLLTM